MNSKTQINIVCPISITNTPDIQLSNLTAGYFLHSGEIPLLILVEQSKKNVSLSLFRVTKMT